MDSTADENSATKSRRERRKEARLEKNKKKFDSWVQHKESQKLNKLSRDSKSRDGEKLPREENGSHHNLDDIESESMRLSNSSAGKVMKRKKDLTRMLRAKFELDVDAQVGDVSAQDDMSPLERVREVHKKHKPTEGIDGEIAGEGRKKKTKKSKIILDSLNNSSPSNLTRKKRKKTKFEEYLDKEGAVSMDKDLDLERKLAKKLKVKEGKLQGGSDDLNMLFEGIPSVLDYKVPDAEEASLKCHKNSSARKKRVKRSSEQEPHVEITNGDTVAESEPLKSSGAEVASEELSTKAPALEGHAKYVAPQLRSRIGNESEENSQIRRRIRGLLNRLSESNVEAVTGEVSTIFQSVQRSVGSQIIIEEVLASCSGGPRGNEQHSAVFAAFVAGMACMVGIDFGAKLLASLAKCFEEEYLEEDNLSLRNLTLLLSYLYIFGICSRWNRVNELKASSGDDQANTRGKRMEFMLETICDIKNNKRRPKEDSLQHTRIKKWLQKVHGPYSSLSMTSVSMYVYPAKMLLMLMSLNYEASLFDTSSVVSRIQLTVDNVLIRGLTWSKLTDPHKKVQWWLSGDITSTTDHIKEVAINTDREILEAQKLLKLATAQRMNTDARRAIFCIIMSGEDYVDAFEKLLRLDLPGKQDREIMRVLVECCLQEKVFNKYYCVLASKLCSHDKNHKFTLQYCLWDRFKELESMQLIRSMHLAKFVVEMLASFSLSLASLKVVDLNDVTQLTPKRIMHFRMLFETLFEQSDKIVWNIFTRIAGTPEYETLRSGIQFFVNKYVVSGQKSFSGKYRVAKKAINNVEGVLL
ncbi:hypothetical protein RJ639_022122 [Escallonia herrerae]|uniref:MI domain-containing protein n=1 Tax=Escallonia herrerae TaxID=1293975 RepID=A0AA88V938_9ASTE|nr:hypothetical protein RJ639_022122 [Escallonia herrerae]